LVEDPDPLPLIPRCPRENSVLDVGSRTMLWILPIPRDLWKIV